MSKRFRIVYCEGNVDGTIGGSYFSLLYLVSGLDRQRFEPIVVFRKEHALMPRFRDVGVDVRVIPLPRSLTWGLDSDAESKRSPLFSLVSVIRRAANFFKVFVWDGIRLARWLRSIGADLVHLNNSVTRTHSWMLAAKISRLPCITHERGINRYYSKLSRYFAPRLDKVICISEAVKRSLLDHCVTEDNLVVIYNGIDVSDFRPLRSVGLVRDELGIGEGSLIVGIVGNIRAWKGQEVVVKAVGSLHNRYPTLFCLLVGDTTRQDRPYFNHLQRLAKELAIEDNIIFTGYKDNVADYVNAMDIVIHASVDPEPFGRVLIEAMALGKPIIGSRAGAVPEILDEPNCGLTFPPGDQDALASTIVLLLDNESIRKAIGESGQKRVQDHFGIRKNVRETELTYLEFLNK